MHLLGDGQVAGGQAEENVTLTGGLAVLATGAAEVVPGTPGWAVRPIEGGGDCNEFVDSGLCFFSRLSNCTVPVQFNRGFFILA